MLKSFITILLREMHIVLNTSSRVFMPIVYLLLIITFFSISLEGTTVGGYKNILPQIIWLSEYKGIVFSGAAIMLLAAGYMMWNARNLPCPSDPEQARACTRLRKISWVIYGFSVLVFLTGAFFAFVAPYIFFPGG